MSVDYHNRTDFRAFDVMVDAIDNASRDEIESAYKTAKECSNNLAKSATKRLIWADFARMLNRQKRAF